MKLYATPISGTIPCMIHHTEEKEKKKRFYLAYYIRIASSLHASTGEGEDEEGGSKAALACRDHSCKEVRDRGAPEVLQKEGVESDGDGTEEVVEEADGTIRGVVAVVVEVEDRKREVAAVGEEHMGLLLVVVVVEDLDLDGGVYEMPCF